MPTNPLVQIARGTHKVGPALTALQLKAAFEMHVGGKVRLPIHADIQAIIIEDDRAVIKYTRYEADVRARETRLNAATIVADVWLRGDTGWGRHTSYEAPDASFRPHAIHESGGHLRDENEQRARRTFEGDCYRPGTGNFPLDNAERTAAGYTTSKMEKHWS